MAKALIAVILCLSFVAPVYAAAPAEPKAATVKTKPAKPDWSELTPAQHKVLAPLKEDWSEIDTARRKKWVKVADGYPKLKPEQQQRLQTRMKDWVKLTPDQRRAAREKYIALKKMPPAKREQVKTQWRQYQQSLAKSEAGGQEPAGSQEAPSGGGSQQ